MTATTPVIHSEAMIIGDSLPSFLIAAKKLSLLRIASLAIAARGLFTYLDRSQYLLLQLGEDGLYFLFNFFVNLIRRSSFPVRLKNLVVETHMA